MFAEILDGEIYKYYADGEWRKSGSGKSVAIVNPTTRQTQYRVQGATPAMLPPKLLLLFLCPVPRTSRTIPPFWRLGEEQDS